MLEGWVTVLYASVIFVFACFFMLGRWCELSVVQRVDSLWRLLLAMAVVVFVGAVTLIDTRAGMIVTLIGILTAAQLTPALLLRAEASWLISQQPIAC
jgi:hypothetical protein